MLRIAILQGDHPNAWTILGEFMGTLVLILLGDGVVANVL